MKSHQKNSNKQDIILATVIQNGKNGKTVTSHIWSFPLLPPLQYAGLFCFFCHFGYLIE